MEILGIGPLELFFIIIIALIVLGPKDMVKAGKTIGHFLRKLVTSSGWRTIQQTSHELKHLPTKLMSEAGLDEIEKDLSLKDIEKEIGLNEINDNIKDIQKDVNKELSDWTTPPVISAENEPENHASSDIYIDAKNDADSTSNSETIANNPAPAQSTSNT